MGAAMVGASAAVWSDAFARRLGAAASADPGEPGLLGAEHEYRVRYDDAPVDFRRLIHTLPVPGRRIDPADPNAYRCGWGGAITADGAEAEVAVPPVALRPGFAGELDGWTTLARTELGALLPDGLELHGYSTHLSVSVPPEANAQACRLYATTFAPALMLLMDGPDSPGLLVRPRPGRTELCGEFVSGERLRAAAAFAAGSARACATAVGDGRPARRHLLPQVRARVEPAVQRYGWYLDRRAFGPDLYAEGREARLRMRRRRGGSIRAQEHLEAAWSVARAALEGVAAPADLTATDRMVAGDLPLPIEGPAPSQEHTPLGAGITLDAPFGKAVEPRRRPAFGVQPVLASWDLTVFEVRRGDRTALASVPRAALPTFLDDLDAGRLDPVLLGYLAEPPTGRVLGSWQQAQAPGLFDSMGPATGMVAPERQPVTTARTFAGQRPGKRERPPGRPPTPAPGRGRRWIGAVVALALVAAIGIGAVVLAGGGDEPPVETTTPPETTPPVSPTGEPTTTEPATTPPSTTAAPGDLPPAFGPITAAFVQPITSYFISAIDPEGKQLDYTWSNTADCGEFTAGNEPVATWNHPHGDPDISDCPGETRHEGIITVVFTDGAWVCTAVYPDGSAPGSGDPPQPCQPVEA